MLTQDIWLGSLSYANGQTYEHTGGRSLSAMTKFAKKALTT